MRYLFKSTARRPRHGRAGAHDRVILRGNEMRGNDFRVIKTQPSKNLMLQFSH